MNGKLSMKMFISYVMGMNSDCSISKHCFNFSSCHYYFTQIVLKKVRKRSENTKISRVEPPIIR